MIEILARGDSKGKTLKAFREKYTHPNTMYSGARRARAEC